MAVPHTGDHVAYAAHHVRELIDRYRPSVLWNDICWPSGGDLPALFADYCNAVPDGVINDRWIEAPAHRSAVTDALARVGGRCCSGSGPAERHKSLTFPAEHHYDIRNARVRHV